MSNIPQQTIQIQRIQETKGDQEERILPDSDQEDFSSSPKSNPDIKLCQNRSFRSKKNIRFSFQNQVCVYGQTSPKSSPGQSPRKESHSILKPKTNSIFSNQNK